MPTSSSHREDAGNARARGGARRTRLIRARQNYRRWPFFRGRSSSAADRDRPATERADHMPARDRQPPRSGGLGIRFTR